MRRTTSLWLALGAAGALAPLACAELPDFAEGTCGDVVLDPGEDCDSAAPSGSRCGAPGEAGACQLLCDDTSVCPEDLACGLDGICRKASDAFATRVDLAPFSRLEVGDLDGDGREDVITADGESRIDATYFAGQSIATQVRLPASAALGLAVGLVQRDEPVVTLRGERERSDVLAGSTAALAVLLGETSRTQIVQAVSSYQFASARIAATPSGSVAYPGTGLSIGDELRPDTEIESVFVQLLPNRFNYFIKNPYTSAIVTIPQSATSPQFDGVVGTIVGAPARAPFFTRPTSCDEVLISFRGTGAGQGSCSDVASCGRAIVAATCDVLGNPNTTATSPDFLPSAEVPILGGEVFVGPGIPFDVDGDLDLDVVLPVERGGTPGLGFALGDGLLGFTRDDARCGNTAAPNLTSCAVAVQSGVVGVADFNDDDIPDWVTLGGVWISVPNATPALPASYYLAGSPSSEGWSEAVIADLNGDGELDVVGVPSPVDRDGTGIGAGTIDVLLASGTSYFNPTVLAGGGALSRLAVGDFDGDLLQDVVARRQYVVSTGCANLEDVVVLFGAADGFPAPPRLVGRHAGIQQIVPGRLPRIDLRDAISDFGVLSRCTEESQDNISVYYGNANRLLDAPISLTDQYAGGNCPMRGDEVVPYVPDAIAASSRPASPDLRVVATVARADARLADASDAGSTMCGNDDRKPFRTELFVYQSDGARLLATKHVVHLPARAGEDPRKFISADASDDIVVRVANLDADPFEEVAVLLPRADGATLFVVDGWACANNISDVTETIEGTTVGCQEQGGAVVVASLELPGFTRLGDDAMTVVDLDDDGVDELLLVGDRGLGPSASIARFAAGAVADAPLEGLSGTFPLAAAITRGASGRDLVVVDAHGGGRAGLRRYPIGDGGALGAGEPLGTDTFACDTDCGLRSGDFDGDGLNDLAVRGTDGTAVLFRGRTFLGNLPTTTEEEER